MRRELHQLSVAPKKLVPFPGPRRMPVARGDLSGHGPSASRRELFHALGCEVIVQDPEDHDRTMAMTHALAFFVAKGLADIGADDGQKHRPPAAPCDRRELLQEPAG